MVQDGGRILGEGAKGYVMDVPYIESDVDTLYEVLKDLPIESLTLIGPSRSLRVKNEDEIEMVKNYLKGSKGIVCKIFKSRIFSESPESVMENEIEGMNGMINIFKGELKKYTTIQIMEILKFKFLGMIVKTSKKSIHMTFNVGCAKRSDTMILNESQLRNLIEDVLETIVRIQKYGVIIVTGKLYLFGVLPLSIVRIQKYGVVHSDIKPDNIVFCESDKRFKLIDFELSSKSEYGDRIHGSLAMSSPIGLYINGYGSSIIPTLVYAGTYMKHRKFLSSPIFKHLYRHTMMEFPMAIKLYSGKEELFRVYKNTIDLYGLCASVALLCVLNGLNYDVFAPFVEKGLSIINPYKNASEALREFRKID